MKGGTTGFRLTSKVIRVSVITSPMSYVINHFQCHQDMDAYFELFLDIHLGKVCSFYSVYLTNWEKLPIFDHFYPGRVFYFAVKYSPLN